MNYRLFVLFICVILSLGFNYEPAGALIAGSGNGQSNSPIHLADMRFPIEVSPAYPNSQVYRPGGLYGGGGSQCDASNYDYPWQDNFCETRSQYSMPMCPDGTGHQGQDIRPSTCDDSTHWVVATENGTITVVGTYSVYLEGVSGIRHRFLHMDMNTVTVNIGDYVTKGQRLGKVSNDFGGTPTTIHLHYDMYKYVSGVGSVYISPYNTLVASYEHLLGFTGIENSGSVCTPTALNNALGNRFEDVLTGSTGEDHIYAIADAGITQGCAPNLFCPDCNVERYQMAVFIARAASLDISNPPSTPSFTDVSSTEWWYPHVEAVKAAGIVSGCSSTEFCPHDSLTRAQAAKFLVLGADLPIISPATPTFSDVTTSDWEYDYVETIKEYCITEGCNGSGVEYCPDDIVSRRVAAIFIARTFDLDDLNTCVNYCDTTTCDDVSYCDDYSDCENFTDDCDETGEQSRECHDFECLGTYTNGTCDYSSHTETQTCSRDTDGIIYSPYSSWGDCNIHTVNLDCSGEGVQERTQGVCSNGISVEETDSQACSVASVDASLLATHEALWFADQDGDGFGDETDSGIIYCADPEDGSVLDNTDCNDSVVDGDSISPSASEICDGIDNDCDGLIDDADPDIIDLSIWYLDTDGDGYGDVLNTVTACFLPTGYASNSDDCNDGDASIYTGASEICDGNDNDCDGLIDDLDPDVVDVSIWNIDQDGDGFGVSNISLERCFQPDGYVIDNTDCDDSQNVVYPGAPEICDDLDNDCDMLTDELDPDVSGLIDWYYDSDGDGFGDANIILSFCDQPEGYVLDSTDCNDNNSDIFPNATEVCDDLDNDCDEEIDDGCSEESNGEETKRESSGCSISSEVENQNHKSKLFIIILLLPLIRIRRGFGE